MGILDKKTRFIDLVVTQEGKRQIASGKLRAEFLSANDSAADYQLSERYEDVVKKIYFEVMERPENSITLETDDSGKLIQFDLSPTGSIVGNKIFEKGTFGDLQEDLKLMKLTTGSQFNSLFNNVSSKVIDNFNKNYFIGTTDSVNINNSFEISSDQINFEILNSVPFRNHPSNEIVNVNDAEPFFFDKKLTHLPNFQFLPPVNQDGTPYGVYEDFRSVTNLNWDNIKRELGERPFLEKQMRISTEEDFDIRSAQNSNLNDDFDISFSSSPIIKPYEIINFLKTSQHNNLLLQIFENNNDSFKKLDIVDGGIFEDPSDVNGNVEKHVFYAGKIYFDDFNTPTFINLFTIIFE